MSDLSIAGVAQERSSFLERFTQRVNSIFLLVAGVILIVIVVLVAQDVIMRYAFQRPTVWVYDVTRYLFAYVVFLGLAPALEAGSHVSFDLFYERMPDTGKKILMIISSSLVVLASLVAVYLLTTRTMEVFADNRLFPAIVALPMKYVYVIGPIGLLQFLLTAVVQLINSFKMRPS